MGFVGIEAVVDAITAKLQADLPAKVAELNAEYADDYTLTDIPAASYYDAVPDPLAASFEYPAVVVLDSDDVAQSEQTNADIIVATYNVVVDILVRGQDATELTRKLWRYERAVKEILTERHALAPTCTSCTWTRTSNTVLTDAASGDLLQDRGVAFAILTGEER